MKKLEFEGLGVQDLSVEEMKTIDGGWWQAFLIGAIAGGMIYDFGKWAITQNNYEYGNRM